ncbi:Uu.00g130660.m01.CDS01, partial [Anthostomella pinea]
MKLASNCFILDFTLQPKHPAEQLFSSNNGFRKDQSVKFNEAEEQKRIRQSTRFKKDSEHSFAESITKDLLDTLFKLANKDKRTFTTALNKFKRYAESKGEPLVEDVNMSGADTASAGGIPSSSSSEGGPVETPRTAPNSSVPPSKEGSATPSTAPTDTTTPVASPENTTAPAASNDQTNPIKREG